MMNEKVLQDIAQGLEALRKAKVEPMGLQIDDRWQWYKYKALPGHPHPGNARNGYSHPTDIATFKAAKGDHKCVTLDTSANDDQLWDTITLPIIKACGLNIKEWAMTVSRYSTGEVTSVDLTRGGVEPFAEYPDAELPVESIGSDSEHKRMGIVRRAEEQSTDAYMQQYAECRTQTIRLRVTDEEKEVISKAASDAGQTLSQYVRNRVL